METALPLLDLEVLRECSRDLEKFDLGRQKSSSAKKQARWCVWAPLMADLGVWSCFVGLDILSWRRLLCHGDFPRDIKPRSRVNLTFAFFRYNLQLAYRPTDQRRSGGKGEDSPPDT